MAAQDWLDLSPLLYCIHIKNTCLGVTTDMLLLTSVVNHGLQKIKVCSVFAMLYIVLLFDNSFY